MVAEVGGMTLLTKKKSASSGLKLILFLIWCHQNIFSRSYLRSILSLINSFQKECCWTLWGSRTGQLWDLREPGTSFCPNRQFWGQNLRWIEYSWVKNIFWGQILGEQSLTEWVGHPQELLTAGLATGERDVFTNSTQHIMFFLCQSKDFDVKRFFRRMIEFQKSL